MVFEHNGFRLASGDAVLASPGPDLGEHTQEVLSGLLGMDDSTIEELRCKEVLL